MTDNPFSDEIIELEWRLQEATASYLSGEEWRGNKIYQRHTIPFHFLKFHHPALEYRGAGEGIKYRKRGSTSGLTDWLLWGPNKWHGFIELKVVDRKLTENQKEVRRWALEYGFPYVICRAVHEVRDALIGWGWKCHNLACREPDHRTAENKKAQAFDLYMPRNKK